MDSDPSSFDDKSAIQYNTTECIFKTVKMLVMSAVIKKMGRCPNKHNGKAI
jgi:hypothetical protein